MQIIPLSQPLASRARTQTCTTIVLHSTDGASATSSINWLRIIRLSYHYIIERDGTIYKCAPAERVALHAGKSNGPFGPNVNEYSIGISFANRESKKEMITVAQVNAVKELVKVLSDAYPTIKFLTRHRDISPGRKTDPAMLSLPSLHSIADASSLAVWP